MTGGLDDDVPFYAEVVPYPEQILLARVAWGVLAFLRVGKPVSGPEDVAVRVDRAGRQPEGGPAGGGGIGQPARVPRESGRLHRVLIRTAGLACKASGQDDVGVARCRGRQVEQVMVVHPALRGVVHLPRVG